MKPFPLTPATKDYLWGGTRLYKRFGKGRPGTIVAESWELSAHPDGVSSISSGPCARLGLDEFAKRHPGEVAPGFQEGSLFPLMIKFIDAKDRLSIQVHPGDDYAARYENDRGKTEMWVIMDCAPGSFVYHGFRQATSRGEVQAHIAAGSMEQLLRAVPVQPGDVIFVPAGTIHAIGAGILLAEIQESSNATYRIYDYNRVGADGKTRPLHLDKGLEVLDFGLSSYEPPGRSLLIENEQVRLERLTENPWFKVYRLDLSNGTYAEEVSTLGNSFASLLCTAGTGRLRCGEDLQEITAGGSLFLPRSAGPISLEGTGTFLLTTM